MKVINNMDNKLLKLMSSVVLKPLFSHNIDYNYYEDRFKFILDMDFGDDLTLNIGDGGELSLKSQGESSEDFWDAKYSRFRPYNVSDGVLTVDISGDLIAGMDFAIKGWFTGYEYLSQLADRVEKDNEVHTVNMIIDSGGGHAKKCSETSEKFYELKKTKEVNAFVDGSAYSAAYFLASSAKNIYLNEDSGTGSVGCLVVHSDYSEAYKKEGIKNTIYRSDELKAIVNHIEPLSEEASKKLKNSVDKMADLFKLKVARNRDLSYDDVCKTRGDTFDCEESLKIGFADKIYSVKQFTEDRKKTKETHSENIQMSENEIVAQNNQNTDLVKEALAESKKRIDKILNCEEAKNRQKMALHLAVSTELSFEDVVNILKISPEEKVFETKNAGEFSSMMEKDETVVEDSEEAPTQSKSTIRGLSLEETGGRSLEELQLLAAKIPSTYLRKGN